MAGVTASAQASDSIPQVRRWMDLSEAEKYIAMCGKSILKLIASGEIYGTKKKGKWYVDKDSVDTYFNEDRIRDIELRLRRRGQ